MRINFFYKKPDAAEIENLLTKYYEGFSTAQDEARLCFLLESPALPEQFLPDKAVLKYFEKKRHIKNLKGSKNLKLIWSTAAAVALLFSLGIYTFSNLQADAYAYVDGRKITDSDQIRQQALASIQTMSASCNEVENSLNQLDAGELVASQLSVFSQTGTK